MEWACIMGFHSLAVAYKYTRYDVSLKPLKDDTDKTRNEVWLY